MKRLTLILLFGLGFTMTAKAELPLAVFRLGKKSVGTCVPAATEAQALVKKYDIKMVSWTYSNEILPELGAIVRETERMYGKPFYPFNHIAVDVDPGYRILGQQVYDPNLRRAKVIVAESDNLPLLAHELGHIIGNSGRPGGGIWYQAYNAAVPTPCHHTQYSSSGWDKGRRNEEFAEVFAAYLTVPRMLKEGSIRCQQAYEFMRKRLFTANDPSCLPKPVTIPLPKPRPPEAPEPVPVDANGTPTTPAPEATQPASPTPPAKPVEQAKPVEPTKPVEQPKPAPAKPNEVVPLPKPKPVETPKPVEVKPVPPAKPVEQTKPAPAPATKPVEQVKPAPATKPVEAAKPAPAKPEPAKPESKPETKPEPAKPFKPVNTSQP